MASLKDQLLKTGLTDKHSVKSTRKKKSPKLAKKARGTEYSEGVKLVGQAQREKAVRDTELNRVRQSKVEKKAQNAQIKQLIDTSKIDRADGELTYNFVFEGKVSTIHVTSDQQKQLTRDQICIVNNGGDETSRRFELVPKVVADKIAQRDERYVLINQTSNESSQDNSGIDDDPYADYQIPDDLIW
ncbi:MAG: DUF2058 domain-containing protein [Proteobacteria bacterium]|jgi:uncharacterized protein|nr:DUF2058 domain-containing protein [Pseudomonadota bacterium]